ncbi:MAG: ABC transporter permease [Tissierellia bacterium]|nr:ABC transporter permease [Tissierellia bacterium]
MFKYIGKRMIYMFLSLFIITTVTFFMMHSIPGNPLSTQMRLMPEKVQKNYNKQYGLDQPTHVQYAKYIKNLVTKGDFGISFKYPGRSITDTIRDTSPVSLWLGLQALAIGLPIGVLLGILAAMKKGTVIDYFVSVVAILGITIPVFILAALFQYVFAVKLRLFPTSGWGTFKHTIIPTMAMCFGPIATYSRYMKSNVLEVVGQDYILTAEAKGVSNMGIIWKHIVRNAILPVITLLGPQIAAIFTGSFIVESMFSIPGLGFYYVTAIQNRDYNMIIGTTVFYAALFVLAQLIVDLLYGVADPRIRLQDE